SGAENKRASHPHNPRETVTEPSPKRSGCSALTVARTSPESPSKKTITTPNKSLKLINYLPFHGHPSRRRHLIAQYGPKYSPNQHISLNLMNNSSESRFTTHGSPFSGRLASSPAPGSFSMKTSFTSFSNHFQ